ncbi:hypothetical protein [Bradyrhizobium sp. Leo121]|uniref:hypothetical protein n=1 Tax=Bradyrhizobium sp. Leo121 TaxID=1571195 RepID=UPI001029BEDF|nr:hypothetical protein [Bradyrhizobium sp. Leo121]RZN33765.1 hypothetical protein CWO90_09140 [Bradyrhizobium sp. Leo121]
MKARLRADVSSLAELDYPIRQEIMWKEDFILEFLRLEQTDPVRHARRWTRSPASTERSASGRAPAPTTAGAGAAGA